MIFAKEKFTKFTSFILRSNTKSHSFEETAKVARAIKVEENAKFKVCTVFF